MRGLQKTFTYLSFFEEKKKLKQNQNQLLFTCFVYQVLGLVHPPSLSPREPTNTVAIVLFFLSQLENTLFFTCWAIARKTTVDVLFIWHDLGLRASKAP